MLFLVDHPLVDPTLIDALLECFSQGGPSYCDSFLSEEAGTSGPVRQGTFPRTAGSQSGTKGARCRGQAA